ncbi:hypothetical protein HD554DRAFT_971224 [Boletus coccyginus]|nr:hypothetical protein HD554DRAFT_971224 [Boletus coccyginus]
MTSHDTIQAYLDSPLVPDEEIKVAGGKVKYWELARATRPRVAQIAALDFLSAPDTSPFDGSCNKCHSGWYERQSWEGKITGGG